MKFVAAQCPQCAGALQVPDDRDTVKCMYCGTDVVVRQAIQLVAGNAKNFLALAKAAEQAENYAEASAYFTRALEIEPTNADAWFGKGTAAGWQSIPGNLRLAEMGVAYENAIKYSKDELKAAVNATCADNLSSAAKNAHKACRKQFRQNPDQDTWTEYVNQCNELLSAAIAAHERAPDRPQNIRNIIDLCADNIKGLTYEEERGGRSEVMNLVLPGPYEEQLRNLLSTYAEKLKAIDSTYEAPNPKRAGSCFVVTATMGSDSHPHVVFLRNFRDDVLVRSKIGRAFVGWYYRHGPTLAEHIARSTAARTLTYALVVVPAVVSARLIRLLTRLC